jgi:CheY-like chemotaxis protein
MESNKSRIIFVVDDDELFAGMLSDRLARKPNHKVTTFNTGEDCIKELLHTHPDVIVLDYFLNSTYKDAMNGLQILEVIRKLDKDVHVIMLSSQERYGVALQTIAKGAERYVIKGPDAFNEVEAVIDAL